MKILPWPRKNQRWNRDDTLHTIKQSHSRHLGAASHHELLQAHGVRCKRSLGVPQIGHRSHEYGTIEATSATQFTGKIPKNNLHFVDLWHIIRHSQQEWKVWLRVGEGVYIWLQFVCFFSKIAKTLSRNSYVFFLKKSQITLEFWEISIYGIFLIIDNNTNVQCWFNFWNANTEGVSEENLWPSGR